MDTVTTDNDVQCAECGDMVLLGIARRQLGRAYCPPCVPLSIDDQKRLTLWKWAYAAEQAGFTRQEARRLTFVAWRTHRVRA